ncbi:hypothetical protein ARMSODRAFT_1007489 [Armillaria solidipes]|uniref:Uncharacterized protein n=1 Tax=Armillaria solidipes TaxID=1076256 RepID=A0A2H3BAD8_9AGAR|nr:hypothetical protein ARMSODRAFT_1007489 [Armillaria solidipes]
MGCMHYQLKTSALEEVKIEDYASIMRTIMKTIMGLLLEPEMPLKCFFEARGDVASPNEAGGIIIKAIIIPITTHNRITSSGGGSTITVDGFLDPRATHANGVYCSIKYYTKISISSSSSTLPSMFGVEPEELVIMMDASVDGEVIETVNEGEIDRPDAGALPSLTQPDLTLKSPALVEGFGGLKAQA